MNCKTTRIAIVLLTLMTSNALFSTGITPICFNGTEDVNGCGSSDYCALINWDDQLRDCCGPGLRQAVKKEWYWCGGCTPVPPDIACPDCEYDRWFEEPDSTCL